MSHAILRSGLPLLLAGLLISAHAQADDLAAVSALTADPSASVTRKLNHNESLLALALQAMQQGHLDQALHQINTLLRSQPDFHLAQLIDGDLLLAHAQELQTIGNTQQTSARLDDLRAEAHARLASLLQPPPNGLVPEEVLQLSRDIPHVIVVDTSKSRLYLFANQDGALHYVADFYVTIGKNGSGKSHEGDERTPLGVYLLTRHLQDKALEQTYGTQAFPLSFPNDWDQREGHSGHGIWLHGTYSGTYSRPPHASDGCVVLTNTDLDTLSTYLTLDNTPVVITDQIHWVTPQAVLVKRDQLMQHVDQWQHDWQSLNIDSYLSNYSSQFTADQTGYAQWSANKRHITANKQWIKVDISHLSLFEYPGQENLYLADFIQDYHSNNLTNLMHKHQYWTQRDGQWKILAEDSQ